LLVARDYIRLKQEIANTLTHGVGAVLSFIGALLLLRLAWVKGDVLHISAAAIYSSTLVMVYVSSTLYHGIQSRTVKRIFRILDHISIYLLIGGSYTPFIFIFLNQGPGITFLSVIWSIIAVGCVLKIFYAHRFNLLSTIIYLALGWMVLLLIEPMLELMPAHIIGWIFAGGLFYTLGTIFFLWKRYLYHHAIWHLFVLVGSLCHYVAVYYCLTESLGF